ncbi:MAG: SGNH/GDSL hydrolase family protein [Sandaracinaceae bacterium]
MSAADATSAAEPAAKRHARVWVGRAALVTLTTVLSLALAELALRALGVGDPILRGPDPVLGWAPIPDTQGTWTREGRSDVRIGPYGFRGVDVAPGPPPEGTLRVAILGDSYTEAKEVEEDERFAAHAERALQRCVGSAEVLAFGVAGYGTAQEYLLLRHRVRRWEPDVVLVAFLSGNDVADNHAALRTSGDPAPYYAIEDGRLVLDDSFRESEAYAARAQLTFLGRARRSSRLMQLVGRALDGGSARADGATELGLRSEIYAPPAEPAWREAWERTEALLARMNEEETARGARFGVITLTNAIQVAPTEEERAASARALGVPDLSYPDRRIAEAGARDGYPVLSLVTPLGTYALEHRAYLHGFENTEWGAGHWNAEGHRVAGERIGRWLCARLGANGAWARDPAEELPRGN